MSQQRFVNIKLVGVDVDYLPTILDALQGTYQTFVVAPYQPEPRTPLPARPPVPVHPSRPKEHEFISADEVVEMAKDNTPLRQLLLRPEGVTLQVLSRRTGASYDAVYRGISQLVQEGRVIKVEDKKGPRGSFIYRIAPIISAT